MEKKEIKVTCEGADCVLWKKIRPFQGDLKSMTPSSRKQLREMIVKYGFNSPFQLWKSTDGIMYLLDGHQRLDVLGELEIEGYAVDEYLPCDYIEAPSREAAKRVLLSRVSQYGSVNKQGLYDYMVESHIDPSELKSSYRVPDLSVDKFTKEYFPKTEILSPEEAFSGLKEGDHDGLQQVTFTLTKDQKKVVTEALEVAREVLKNQSGGNMGPNKNGNAIFYICRQFL